MFGPRLTAGANTPGIELQPVTPGDLAQLPDGMPPRVHQRLRHDLRADVVALLDDGAKSEFYRHLVSDPGNISWGVFDRGASRLLGFTGIRHDTRREEPLPLGWRQVEAFTALFDEQAAVNGIAAAICPYQISYALGIGADVVRLSIQRDDLKVNEAAQDMGFAYLGQFFSWEWLNDFRLYSSRLFFEDCALHARSFERSRKNRDDPAATRSAALASRLAAERLKVEYQQPYTRGVNSKKRYRAFIRGAQRIGEYSLL